MGVLGGDEAGSGSKSTQVEGNKAEMESATGWQGMMVITCTSCRWKASMVCDVEGVKGTDRQVRACGAILLHLSWALPPRPSLL